ncbi:MAG: TraR/DksA family transcriptional regulator [Nitrospiria bacterium]
MTVDCEYFKEKLLKQQKELKEASETGNASAKTVVLDQTSVGRLSRMGALQDQAMSIETNRRRDILLKRISGALQRIDQDEFGDCLRCDEEIDPKRLEIDPTSFFCIDCANKVEQ